MAYTYRNRTSARAEAKAKGEKTYDSGVMAKCGHGSVRLTSSTTCVVCNKLKNEAYVKENRERARQRTREWQKANPGKVNASTRGREVRQQQPIASLFKPEIEYIYETVAPGDHVDHIVPLHHPKVCGLHVPWNLQHLPAPDNLAKGNSFDPNSYQGELARV